jgi:hypothetical protein
MVMLREIRWMVATVMTALASSDQAEAAVAEPDVFLDLPAPPGPSWNEQKGLANLVKGLFEPGVTPRPAEAAAPPGRAAWPGAPTLRAPSPSTVVKPIGASV